MMNIIKGRFTDENGAVCHFQTEAAMVIMPNGRTLDNALLPVLEKTYIAVADGNAAETVDVSDFVQADTDKFSYSLELFSAVSGEEQNLPVVPVLHTATQSVVLIRLGIAAEKSVEVRFRIVKRGL